MPRITSRDNPRLKEAARLIASSRHRRKAGRCVLEGEHIIGAYVERHGDPETLLVAQSVMDRSEIRRLLDVMPSTRVLIVAESAWSALGPMPAAASKGRECPRKNKSPS